MQAVTEMVNNLIISGIKPDDVNTLIFEMIQKPQYFLGYGIVLKIDCYLHGMNPFLYYYLVIAIIAALFFLFKGENGGGQTRGFAPMRDEEISLCG